MTARGRKPTRKPLAAQKGASIPVMLVDDHPLWRQMLRKILEHRRFATVVAEASDGSDALEQVSRAKPAVVLMDIQLPGMDGVSATRRITQDHGWVKVLMLASSEDRAQVLAAVHAGASGYLLKTATSTEVTEAVARIHAGELVFPPALADVVLGALRGEASVDAAREPASAPNVFRRQGDFWTVAHAGTDFLLRDTRGARYLSELLRHPGRELHALDLVALSRGTTGLAGGGDAPEVLDATARASIKQRLTDLAEELEEAEQWQDSERASRAREEIDVLVQTLTKEVALGGRPRRAATPAERARVNVTLALRTTLTKIAENAPALGDHLNATIKTGTYCSYSPDPRAPIVWDR